jgi:hypothetical protein
MDDGQSGNDFNFLFADHPPRIGREQHLSIRTGRGDSKQHFGQYFIEQVAQK